MKYIRELGHISEFHESANKGPGVISSGKGDPGGKSYGTYQLASEKGTLEAYVKVSAYSRLRGVPLASLEFDKIWKDIAKYDPKGFKEDQHAFIKRTHYDKPFKYWTEELDMPDTPAIREVIWSMSVQHKGVKKILLTSSLNIKYLFAKHHIKVVSQALSDKNNEKTIIKILFVERRKYVKKYLNGQTLRSVLNRYIDEEKDVLKLIE